MNACELKSLQGESGCSAWLSVLLHVFAHLKLYHTPPAYVNPFFYCCQSTAGCKIKIKKFPRPRRAGEGGSIMAVMFPCFAKQERTNKKEQGKSDVEGAVAVPYRQKRVPHVL